MTYFRVHESIPLGIILSQINPLHVLFLNITLHQGIDLRLFVLHLFALRPLKIYTIF
jgi:hypothetical protein